MTTINEQTTEHICDAIKGFEQGSVAATKVIYIANVAGLLAAKVRKFIEATEGMSIQGFEHTNAISNTYIHKLPDQQQIQLRNLKKIADGLGISCSKLYAQLISGGGKPKVVEEQLTLSQADDEMGGIDLSRVPGEPQLVLTNIPEIGTIVIGLMTKSVEFTSKNAVKRMLRS